MKHTVPVFVGLCLTILLLLSSCEPERVTIQSGAAGFEGYHVGYSWAGEARGTAFEDANAFIETILLLDEDANILDAEMRYFQQVDGFWTTRQSGQARIGVDFSVDPVASTLEGGYSAGVSMFDIFTVSVMSLYAVAVDDDGTVAVALVEPLTRFQFEMKFEPGYDFETRMADLTIGSGQVVPTRRTAGGNFIAPDSWSELENDHLFDLHRYSRVMNSRGVFEGIDGGSTVRDFLQAMDVSFSGATPQPMDLSYGYFGIGGWAGNYTAIANYLIGQNARDITSLVDWSAERYQRSINDQNQFGVDVETGATRTAQLSTIDGIAGATVRMSRESTSYQRALVDAGVISEEDVIIGRF